MGKTAALHAVRTWLQGEYRALLKTDLADDPGSDWSAPAWIWTDADLHRVHDVEHARGAMLLDPEMGLALAIQPFDAETRLLEQLGRALAIRSRLVPEAAGRAAHFDEHGPWHLALHWLVEPEQRDAWLEQAAEIRNETAHIEEIPIDYIEAGGVHGSGDPHAHWREGCNRHRFPRLLLATRALFRRQASEVSRWASADERAREALQAELARFTAPDSAPGPARVAAELTDWLRTQAKAVEKQPAAGAEEAAAQPGQDTAVPPLADPTTVRRLTISNLRNIASLDLPFAPGKTATVVHGPNGTGKSNLFEALSLALSGASRRCIAYLDDQDIATRRSTKHYVDQYLSRWEGTDSPRTLLETSGDSRALKLAADATEARRRLQHFDGTLLGQDQARGFVQMPGDELGALAMGAHSDLAQDLLDHVQERLDEARGRKNQLLKHWQLSTQITKPDTAATKIALGMLSQVLGAPQPQVGWLAALLGEGLADPIASPMAGQPTAAAEIAEINTRWAAWPQHLQQTAAHVANSALAGDTAAGADAIIALIHEHDQLLRRTGDMLRTLADQSAQLSTELLDQAERWGRWLEQQTTAAPTGTAAAGAEERARLQAALTSVRRHGEGIRAHLDHLDAVERFLAQHWHADHAGDCPTCGTDVQAQYGQDIHGRLATMKQSAAEALQIARRQYAEHSKRLKTLDAEMVKLGAAPCPLDTDQQLRIAEGLAIVTPREDEIAGVLRDPERRRSLLANARRLIGVPLPPNVQDTPGDDRAQRVLGQITDELAKIRHALAEPAAWEAVHKAVQQTLSQALQEHLPETIGRVWFELTMALTPARWQLPSLPQLQSEAARRKHRISVRMQEHYARHLLNEAEAHTLGLAWFLQRHLTSGRFRYALLAMDDPAQEMDQPAFRDLCRLLETLLRLHRIHNRPLNLLVLLHQDERALDLVRATDANLLRLGWNRTVPGWLREMRLRAGPAQFPLPVMLLDSEAGSTNAPVGDAS